MGDNWRRKRFSSRIPVKPRPENKFGTWRKVCSQAHVQPAFLSSPDPPVFADTFPVVGSLDHVAVLVFFSPTSSTLTSMVGAQIGVHTGRVRGVPSLHILTSAAELPTGMSYILASLHLVYILNNRLVLVLLLQKSFLIWCHFCTRPSPQNVVPMTLMEVPFRL